MILDRLETSDGFTIYWVHESGENTIYEEDLFHCEYNLMDFISDKLRTGNWDIDEIVNHCECDIDLIDLHREVLLEESEYIYRYSYNEYFKGISDNDLIEMCQEYITPDMEDEYLKNIEDGEEIDFVISVLEDKIKGIEIES
jgi:hypothetical protein